MWCGLTVRADRSGISAEIVKVSMIWTDGLINHGLYTSAGHTGTGGEEGGERTRAPTLWRQDNA